MAVERPITLRGDGDEHRLADVLASLKERGCSILVAGEVPVPTPRTVSRRLFGHPAERRERVLLRLRQTNSLAGWFPRGIDLADRSVRIIDCTDPGRSTLATGDCPGSDGPAGRWDPSFDPAETPSLSRQPHIEDCLGEIDAIAAGVDSLEPSQLRVGLFSLDVLDSPAEMTEVVSAVSTTVTDHRGMVHYHLPEPPTSETARAVLDHVDARITVRKDVPGKPAMQRWHIPGYGETPWIRLSSHE